MNVVDPTEAFAKLEQKLEKAVEVLKQFQTEKRALEQEVEKLRVESKERARRLDALEREVRSLRLEREDVRSRIEKVIDQIDVLTKTGADG